MIPRAVIYKENSTPNTTAPSNGNPNGHAIHHTTEPSTIQHHNIFDNEDVDFDGREPIVHGNYDGADEILQHLAANPHTSHYLPDAFKIEKGLYQFGQKKVHLSIIDREVLVRVGGGYIKFADYMKQLEAKNKNPIIGYTQPPLKTEEEFRKQKDAVLSPDIHSITLFPSEIEDTGAKKWRT